VGGCRVGRCRRRAGERVAARGDRHRGPSAVVVVAAGTLSVASGTGIDGAGPRRRGGPLPLRGQGPPGDGGVEERVLVELEKGRATVAAEVGRRRRAGWGAPRKVVWVRPLGRRQPEWGEWRGGCRRESPRPTPNDCVLLPNRSLRSLARYRSLAAEPRVRLATRENMVESQAEQSGAAAGSHWCWPRVPLVGVPVRGRAPRAGFWLGCGGVGGLRVLRLGAGAARGVAVVASKVRVLAARCCEGNVGFSSAGSREGGCDAGPTGNASRNGLRLPDIH